MEFYGTRQAAKLLDVNPGTLTRAVWDGRVTPPQKSPSGQFLWTERDIEQASWVLHRRSFVHQRGQVDE